MNEAPRTAVTIADETPALLEPLAEARRTVGPRAPRTGRFHLVYFLVLAAAVGVIALGIHASTGVTRKPHVVRWHATGATPLAAAQAIAKHYTGLELKGFEPNSSPTVTVRRAADLHLGAMQFSYGGGLAQMAFPPADDVYVICGHGESCSLLEPPTIKREIRLRRLVLGLVVDTLSLRKPPKHVLVSLPSASGLWLAVYSRDDFSDAQLRAYRSLVARLATAKRPSKRDLDLLVTATTGRVYALRQEVATEDETKVVVVVEQRPCFDAACPSTG